MRHLFRNIVLAVLVAAPLTVAAQTIDPSALAAQIAALQAQLAAVQQQGSGGSNAGAHCVTLDATLAKGDSGADVADLQNFLISEGMLEAGSATGFFGTLTESAVKQWQASHSIDPLGVVGPKTRTAMGACAGGTPSPNLISNQCPTVTKPTTCANAVSVQLNGCTVGWQCSVPVLPEQTFSASPLSGPTPLVVKFSGTVTSANAGFCAGNFCAATLVFGDGATGAVPLPNADGAAIAYSVTHTYTKGGPFIANLYQGAAGSGAPVVGNGITINPIAPVVASSTGPTISVTPSFGTAPLPVTVSVGNVPSGANLSVEFGDGSFASLQSVGSSLVATHTYINGGSYTIKLRRVNNAGESCVSATCQVLATTGLSIGTAQVASAALSPAPTTGLAPLPVTFFLNGGSVAYSGGVVLDFGDNTTEIVCAANVLCGQKQSTHTYGAAGTYNVQLLGIGNGGTTILRTSTVTAVTPGASSLSASPASGAVPLAVTFTGNGGNQTYVNGAIIKYGDDSTETFCNPNEICGQKTKTHTYNDGSQYSAQLIGLGDAGASSTIGSVVVTATGGPTKIKVTGPTGTARKGDSVSLAWTVRGTKPTSGSISFDLYTLAGTRIGTILTITNFQSGAATWKIPSTSDKSCTTTQPNGLCGVNLTPGTYKVQPYITGTTVTPELSSDATVEIKDEVIPPSNFSVSITPSSVEYLKPMSIKYRVTNPPFNGGVALWLVKPTGESVGLISGKLDADTEQTTFPWTAGALQFCEAALFNPNIACSQQIRAFEPGTYHILAKVYSPFDGKYTDASAVTIHAVATSTAFTIKDVGTGAACVVLDSNLAPGDTDATTGGDVTRLQQFLAQDSDIYPEGTVSGFYGNATRRAVERYQAAHGIVTSGSPETNGFGAVGPTTRAAIASDCGGNTDYLFRAAPKTGRAPLAVSFTATLNLSANQTAAVDFGDGASAPITAGKATAHTYQTSGTYIAKLIISGSGCTQDACTGTAQKIAATVSVVVTNITTPPPQACAAITHTLSAEDTDALTGGDVSRLQQYLAADPVLYPEGLVTGFYGPATAKAVGRYQESKGISKTGTVGPITLTAIRCTPDNGSSDLFTATPVSGTAPLLVRFATNKNVTTGSYRVDFGDGATQWLSASSTTHTYSTAGAYTAQLVQSVGNCFGLTGDALKICEIGNTQVLSTKAISVGQTPATISVSAAPISIPAANKPPLNVAWSATNVPTGSKVRLELYRDGDPEPVATGNNDHGLASGTSELQTTGTYSWTFPTGDAILADAGFGGFSITPGTYHITAKLYTGSVCWGYCNGAQDRAVSATGKSNNFTINSPVASIDTGGITGDCALKLGGNCVR